MIDLKRLLKFLSKLHDGHSRSQWPSPIVEDEFINTASFWSKFKDKYDGVC